MISFSGLVQEYLTRSLADKPSHALYVRLVNQYFRGWASHRTKFQLAEWHRSLKATPAQANKALGFLVAMYGWAQRTGDQTGRRALWEEENPAKGIPRHESQSREIVLTDAQLVALLHAAECMSQKAWAFLVFLLCTGCRMSEARVTRWEHLDLENRSWHKPTTKNKTSHRVPIPEQVVQVVSHLPRHGDYVFPGLHGHPWSRCAAEKTWGQIRAALDLRTIKLHDFRRTVASRVYAATKDERLVKAVLNHRDGSLAGRYIRLNAPYVAQALQAHADAIWALVKEDRYAPIMGNGGADVVVPGMRHQRGGASTADSPRALVEQFDARTAGPRRSGEVAGLGDAHAERRPVWAEPDGHAAYPIDSFHANLAALYE